MSDVDDYDENWWWEVQIELRDLEEEVKTLKRRIALLTSPITPFKQHLYGSDGMAPLLIDAMTAAMVVTNGHKVHL